MLASASPGRCSTCRMCVANVLLAGSARLRAPGMSARIASMQSVWCGHRMLRPSRKQKIVRFLSRYSLCPSLALVRRLALRLRQGWGNGGRTHRTPMTCFGAPGIGFRGRAIHSSPLASTGLLEVGLRAPNGHRSFLPWDSVFEVRCFVGGSAGLGLASHEKGIAVRGVVLIPKLVYPSEGTLACRCLVSAQLAT